MEIIQLIQTVVPETFQSFLDGNYFGLITILGLTVMGIKIMPLVWSLGFAVATVTWIASMAQIAQQQQAAWASVTLAASVFVFISLYVIRWLQTE